MRHRVTDRVTEKPEGRSIPLGYPGPPHCSATTFGANGGTRTLDLLFTKQLLYQLSYIGASALCTGRL